MSDTSARLLSLLSLEWLALRAAQLGCEFEVHEPPELIEHLRDLGDRIKRAVVRG